MKKQNGFTLVELAIVLVIIGLIVGGVLAGQDLIQAASVRAQVSQISKYNAAVNTFRTKYGGIPGDLIGSKATQFGFIARGTPPGEGDGNGIIEGNLDGSRSGGGFQVSGEPLLFWTDLSAAGLIDASLKTLADADTKVTVVASGISGYLPPAKLGGGNFINVWSGGYNLNANSTQSGTSGNDGKNYFQLSAVKNIGGGPGGYSLFSSYTAPGVSVQQAYNIDDKIDDGLPQSGLVMAIFLNADVRSIWAPGVASNTPPYTTATAQSATTCFDNGNVVGVQKYSVGYKDGTSLNCALSFRFQ